mgnify:CR=1 FL=1
MIKNIKSFEHDSAIKHVTGKATYTDDILEPNNLLHAAIGYSQISRGEIIKIDFTDVIKSKGVIDIITEKDIEGINEVGPVFKGDQIFSKKIKFHGQPIFAVAATSYRLAKKAASKVKIKFKETKPILNIKEALKKKSFVHDPQYLIKGDAIKIIKKSKYKLKGELYSGGQDHFYLEGQISVNISSIFEVFFSPPPPAFPPPPAEPVVRKPVITVEHVEEAMAPGDTSVPFPHTPNSGHPQA